MRVDRLSQMREYIVENGTITINSLCDRFNVSIYTARRDINLLVKEGSVLKVYGGVKVNDETELVPYENRFISNKEEKRSIGKVAASFIKDGEIIFMDTGTTVAEIIEFIGDKYITIITNNLQVLIKAVEHPNIDIYILAGALNRKTNSFEETGNSTFLEKYNITKAFMSASGYTIEGGVTHASPWEFELKSSIIAKKVETYLLVDHTKFNKVTMIKYANASEIKDIITTEPVSDKYKKFFAENNITLHIAK